MAEGFLKKFGPELQVYSAGTHPAKEVNPNSITVMKEAGIDISSHKPKNIKEFLDQSFDFVITVCDNANEACPVFSGKVKNNLHISFIDPADAKGSRENILEEYREVRDEIKSSFRQLYDTRLKE